MGKPKASRKKADKIVPSEVIAEAHAERFGDSFVYGQESIPISRPTLRWPICVSTTATGMGSNCVGRRKSIDRVTDMRGQNVTSSRGSE